MSQIDETLTVIGRWQCVCKHHNQSANAFDRNISCVYDIAQKSITHTRKTNVRTMLKNICCE